MITVIIGTNSSSSSTNAIASIYKEALRKYDVDFQIADLQYLSPDFVHNDMYFNRSRSFEEFQDKYLTPTQKYVIIVPEYNGGIPGIFKLMMDASDITKAWWNKKACLCGVAAGRAGNLRGLDNLTNILNYLKVDVLKNKIPISRINEFVVNGVIEDPETVQLIHAQVDEFISF